MMGVCKKEGSKCRPAQIGKKAKDEQKNSPHQDPYRPPQRLRTPSTSRYAENCARKRGALESCVAHRKWRSVDMHIKERAPAMRVRHQRANEEGCRLWMDTRWTVPSGRICTPDVGHLKRRVPMPSRPAHKRTSGLDAEAGIMACSRPYSASGGGRMQRGVCASRARAGQRSCYSEVVIHATRDAPAWTAWTTSRR
jgi:hypothetical protein